MSTDYGSWNINELKDELRKLGANVAGRKHELVESRECNPGPFLQSHPGISGLS